MRLVILDFDKTLTIIDSGLMTCLFLVFKHPSLLASYIRCFFVYNEIASLRLKLKTERAFCNSKIKSFARLNKKRRLLRFLKKSLFFKNEVIIVSGTSSEVISKYMELWGFDNFDIKIFGRDKLKAAISLREQKRLFLESYLSKNSYTSIININDNYNELNDIKYGKKIRVLKCF